MPNPQFPTILKVTPATDNRILRVNDSDAVLRVSSNPTIKLLTVGIQGVAGASGQGYVHNQLVASSTWSVTHGLNKNPSVTVVDSGDSVVVGEVQYLDLNSLQITFSAPFSGKAYMN